MHKDFDQCLVIACLLRQQQEPFFKKFILSKNDSSNAHARMIDDEFTKDLQKKLQNTQRRWTTKLEELNRHACDAHPLIYEEDDSLDMGGNHNHSNHMKPSATT